MQTWGHYLGLFIFSQQSFNNNKVSLLVYLAYIGPALSFHSYFICSGSFCCEFCKPTWTSFSEKENLLAECGRREVSYKIQGIIEQPNYKRRRELAAIQPLEQLEFGTWVLRTNLYLLSLLLSVFFFLILLCAVPSAWWETTWLSFGFPNSSFNQWERV